MEIRENFNLKPYHTFHTDVRTRYWATATHPEEAAELKARFGHLRTLFLGEGSNVLFLQDFDGIIIRNEIKGIDVIKRTPSYEIWEIGGGENWHEVVRQSVNAGVSGIENLALIPGKAGTAPVQNIGAYGREIKDVLIDCDVLDTETGKFLTLSASECRFGYRHSLFKEPSVKGRYFIYKIRLKLIPGGRPETEYASLQAYLKQKGITRPGIRDVFNAVTAIRRQKLPDPQEIGNAGSFFKNPVVGSETFEALYRKHPDVVYYPTGKGRYKIPAAWLIDRAGWKGYREGDAGVHPRQAVVLVNYGRASGQDIYRLSEKIIEDIRNKFDIILEREVQIIS